MEPALQGLSSLARRVGSRKGDDGEIGAGQLFHGGIETRRLECRARGSGARLFLGEEIGRGRESDLDGGGVGAIHRHDEIVGSRTGELRTRIALVAEQFEIHGRAHCHDGIPYAMLLFELLAQGHQKNGIEVRIFTYDRLLHDTLLDFRDPNSARRGSKAKMYVVLYTRLYTSQLKIEALSSSKRTRSPPSRLSE